MGQKREKYGFVWRESSFTTARFLLDSNMCVYFWMTFPTTQCSVWVYYEILKSSEQNNSFCVGSMLIWLLSSLLKLSIVWKIHFTDLLSQLAKTQSKQKKQDIPI